MAPSTEQMLEALRQDNARLRRVEAELAAAMESLRGSEERLRLASRCRRDGSLGMGHLVESRELGCEQT